MSKESSVTIRAQQAKGTCLLIDFWSKRGPHPTDIGTPMRDAERTSRAVSRAGKPTALVEGRPSPWPAGRSSERCAATRHGCGMVERLVDRIRKTTSELLGPQGHRSRTQIPASLGLAGEGSEITMYTHMSFTEKLGRLRIRSQRGAARALENTQKL